MEKYGQNQLFRSRLSILGQAPSPHKGGTHPCTHLLLLEFPHSSHDLIVIPGDTWNILLETTKMGDLLPVIDIRILVFTTRLSVRTE